VVTHLLQVERGTVKVRRPETDVLPLCHATNYMKKDATISSADAEIARQLATCESLDAAKVQNSIYSIPGSQDITMRVGFGKHVHVVKTLKNPRFVELSYMLCT